MSNIEEIEVLMGLGLTSCQARVYLALCRFGALDAKTLSKYTGIPRQDVYRVVAGLKEFGFIEKVLTRPTTFRALPVNKGTSILLRQKKRELERLEKKTRVILEKFKCNNIEFKLGKSEFVFVPKREAVVERIRGSIEKAKRTVDLLLSWERFRYGMYSFTESLEKARGKNVRFRFILEKPKKDEIPQASQLCSKIPFCKVKFLPTFPKTVMGIYDKKEIYIIVDPRMGLSESPALWSNNPSLLAAMNDYFDILWITTMENPYTPPNGGQV